MCRTPCAAGWTRTPGLLGTVFRNTPPHGEFHEATAKDAYQRMLAFFHEHL
jgi:carboxymethylenebutenolidase